MFWQCFGRNGAWLIVVDEFKDIDLYKSNKDAVEEAEEADKV